MDLASALYPKFILDMDIGFRKVILIQLNLRQRLFKAITLTARMLLLVSNQF